MKVTIKAWICASQSTYSDKPFINVFSFDPTKMDNTSEFVVVKYFEQDVEVDETIDLRPELVKNLERQRQQLRADFAKSITDIERRISELTAIGCEVAA